MFKRLMVSVALGAISVSSAVHAEDSLKIGVMATLEGTYTVLGQDSISGFEVAYKEHDDQRAARNSSIPQGIGLTNV